MNFNSEIFKVAMQSLWANKTRSLLTMLGVIIGVAAVIALVSIGSGLKVYIADQFEALGSNLIYIYPADLSGIGSGSSSGGASSLSSSVGFERRHREAIGRLDLPIDQVSALIQSADKAQYGGNSFGIFVMGVESGYGQMSNVDIELGRFFTESEDQRSKKVALIGSKVKEEIFPGIDPLGKKLLLAGTSFEVIGVLEEQGGGGLNASSVDSMVIIPLSAAESIFDTNQYDSIVVKAKDKSDIETIKAALEEEMGKYLKEDEFSVFDQKQILNQVDDILGILTMALGGIAAISLLVGGIGIMNIMLVSVTERTAEIGLRKAVGAKNNDILAQFIVEAVFLSVSGGIIGIIMGFVGSFLINSFLIRTSVTAWSVILAFSISALIGIIFGVTPANKAAKLDPVEALRHS